MKRKIRNFLSGISFSPLYEEAGLPKDIRKSLNLIFCSNVAGNLYGLICGSGTAAMVGLATALGANDLVFGILTAIGQAVALMQIPFSLLVNKTQKRKKYLLTFGLAGRALWILFGLIPIIIPDIPGMNLRLWALIFLMGLASLGTSVIGVCWFPWFSDLCPMIIRSRWLSVREAFMYVLSMVFGLVVAWLLDVLPPENRYIIIFIVGGVVGSLDMFLFAFCKEVFSAKPKKIQLKEALKDIRGNKVFIRFLLMWTVWCFTYNFGAIYFTPYSMNAMGLTTMQVMIFGTVASYVTAIFVVGHWGKAIYKFGSRNCMLVSGIAVALVPVFYLFSTPGNIWPMFIHYLIGPIFWCGANLTSSSLQLSTTPDSIRPSYLAVFNCVTAIVGTTLGSLLGGALLDWWEKEGWFTGYFDRYKVLFTIDIVLRLSGVLLLVPKLENERDATPKDLLKAILFGRRYKGR